MAMQKLGTINATMAEWIDILNAMPVDDPRASLGARPLSETTIEVWSTERAAKALARLGPVLEVLETLKVGRVSA